MTDISISLPAKRRRGRPRKDANSPQDGSLHRHSPGLPAPAQLARAALPAQEPGPNLMVGSSIYGVIEGSFDAGYLISVKSGNGGTPFRGVVFQPKMFVPIMPDNDVAPQAQMYLRREITSPFPDGLISPASNSLTTVMMGPTFDVRPMSEYMDNMHYDGLSGPSVTFHHDLFADPSRPDSSEPTCLGPEYHRSEFTEHIPKSTNLKLDLSSSVHEKNDEARWQANYLIGNETKSLNLGYHNALVSGNPLFLPPDFNGEPLDFMVGKNLIQMSSGARQETSNEDASSPSGPYMLELATPQSTINARPGLSVGCITDMDYVINETVQRTEHHGEFSENKQ